MARRLDKPTAEPSEHFRRLHPDIPRGVARQQHPTPFLQTGVILAEHRTKHTPRSPKEEAWLHRTPSRMESPGGLVQSV